MLKGRKIKRTFFFKETQNKQRRKLFLCKNCLGMFTEIFHLPDAVQIEIQAKKDGILTSTVSLNLHQVSALS